MRRRKAKTEGFHLEEKTKRRLSLGAIIASSLVIAVVLILVISGIRVSFRISEELNPIIEPKYQGLEVFSGRNATMGVTVTNENFLQCRSRCTASLYSYKDMEIQDNQTFWMGHKETATFNWTVQAPAYGSGKELYIFELACSNVRSLVCLTEEEPRYRSSIVSLEYKLTEKEERIKEDIRDDLEVLASQAAEITSQYKAATSLVSMIPEDVLSLEQEALNDRLDGLRVRNAEMMELWEKEDYTGVEQAWDEGILDEAFQLQSDTMQLKEKASALIGKRNRIISSLKELAGRQKDIREFYHFLLNESNDKNIRNLLRLRALAEGINDAYNSALKGNLDYDAGIAESADDLIGLLEMHEQDMEYGEWLAGHSRSKLMLKGLNISYEGSLCDRLNAYIDAMERENDRVERAGLNLTDAEEGNLKRFLTRTAIGQDNQSYLNLSSYPRRPAIDNVTQAYRTAEIETRFEEAFTDENCFAYEPAGIDTSPIDRLTSLDMEELEIIEPGNTSAEVPETSISENPPMCCTFGECVPCQDYGRTPILFIHGHSFNEGNTPEESMNIFTELQRMLEQEKILNYGELELKPLGIREGEWGESNRSISVRASYYYITHYTLGSYDVTAQKSESIESYAIRLKEMIGILKERAGSDDVTVVAHSMGGLVLREYGLLFGYDSIDKGILINTPNHGVTDNVARYCSVFGANKECDQMKKGSIFLSKLNEQEPPDNLHVIRSTGCEMTDGKEGDGIVTEDSAYLQGAENYLIRGECTDRLGTDLHSNVLDPGLYPETYELIVRILE